MVHTASPDTRLSAQELTEKLRGTWKNGKGKAHCPAHDDQDPSLAITEENGKVLWYCHVGCKQDAVLKRLQDLGLWPKPEPKKQKRGTGGNGARKHEEWQPIVPPPDGTPLPDARQLKADMLFEYRGADDGILFYVRRVNCPGNGSEKSGKDFYPLTYGVLKGRKAWHNKAPAAPRPLYRLNRLATADGTVVLCEGEKAANAAQSMLPDHVCMSWMGGAKAAGTADLSPLNGRDVILWPDADEPGLAAMVRIAKALTGIGASVRGIIDTEGLPRGFDAADLEHDGCEEPEAWLNERLRPVPDDKPALDPDRLAWMKKCQRDRQGQPHSNLHNALAALRHAPKLHDAFAFDQMQCTAMVRRELPGCQREIPRSLEDCDVSAVQEWLQGAGLVSIGFNVVQQAIAHRAHERRFHPVRDYLNRLKWDGKERLSSWLHVYLGAKQNAYTAGIGSMFLKSMVARIFKPGCKVDYYLILEDPEQGTQKSLVCAILGGEWYSDHLPDLGDDAVRVSMHLRGKWLIEIAELSAVEKAHPRRLKSFMSRRVEKFIPKYGRNEVSEPRQCVFIGTTNHQVYLRDETGERRPWPVRTDKIKLDELERDRDQLFAEAVERFHRGERWWPDAEFEAEHARPEQDARFDADVWEGLIATYLLGRTHTTVFEVATATDGVGIPKEKIGRAEQNRIVTILEKLGWRRGKRSAQARPWLSPEQYRREQEKEMTHQ
jgi:predicted P-loop ATPase